MISWFNYQNYLDPDDWEPSQTIIPITLVLTKKFQTTMKPPPTQNKKINDPIRRLATERPAAFSEQRCNKCQNEEGSGWSSRAAGLETTVGPLPPDMDGGHVMM